MATNYDIKPEEDRMREVRFWHLADLNSDAKHDCSWGEADVTSAPRIVR